MPGPERDDQRPDVLARQDLVEPRLLDVQQLPPEREDRLVAPVAALLGRATGRVALDEVQLAASGVPLLAVGQLARQRHAVERALADDEVASLARGLAGARRRQALLDDPAPVGRVLVEVLAEAVGDRRLDLALDLGVAELGLRLALELGIGQLDADDRGQALADVVAGQVAVRVAEHARSPRPVVERARQGRPEAGDVGAAIDGVDVVGEGEDVLGVRVVVLEGDLDGRPALAPLDVDRAGVEDFLVAVQVPHERLEAALEVERALAVVPLVDERDPDPLVQVCRLAQALADRSRTSSPSSRTSRCRP